MAEVSTVLTAGHRYICNKPCNHSTTSTIWRKDTPLAHAKELQSIYEQLYPRKKITHMLLFYRQCGWIKLAGNIIGSIKQGSNSTTSAVVICMSFWPGSGHSLQSIEYGRMWAGVVQYFLQHSVTVCDGEPSMQFWNTLPPLMLHPLEEGTPTCRLVWNISNNLHWAFWDTRCMLLHACTTYWLSLCVW